MEIPMNRRNATTLPEELIFSEILPKIPAKSLIRFKCVSKEWLDIITNGAALKKAHARHHTARNSAGISFIVHALKRCGIGYHKLLLVSGDDCKCQTNINPLEVVEFDMSYLRSELEQEGSRAFNRIKVFGSSNGLVLFSKPLTWWNPVTKEFRVLPEVPQSKYNDEFLIMDLGLDDESGDHKVVRVSDHKGWALNFQVFSKKADSWWELKTVSGFSIWGWARPPVPIDGAFYFLASQGSGKIVVLSFMYRNLEVRNVIDAPNYYSPDGRLEFSFEVKLVRWKKDSLALIVMRAPEHRRVFDLWGMVKSGDGGNEFCWSKLFVFNDRPYIRGVWTDQLFLIIQGSSCGISELVLWDPQTDGEKDGCLELVKLPESSWRFGIISDYIPTLISVFPDP